MSQITVFSSESHSLSFTDRKGNEHAITAEGACWKGGAALTALKDKALESAMLKAVNGRYQAAVDIMAAAFAATHKAGTAYLIGGPAANKANFTAHCHAILNVKPKEGKDFSAKQRAAQVLARAYLKATAPETFEQPLPVVEQVEA